ncbi:hypothetical protein ACE1TI_14130 [Alteribacillus sp. JSM 102045]|uniref:hypothetical protein n=1 Tax=Alteribacillus sp. JSM 102045 TaxID=1562101 RepID=UPI0035C20A0F
MDEEIYDFIQNIEVDKRDDKVFSPAEINEELFDSEKPLEDVLASLERLAEEGKIARTEGTTQDGYKGQLFTCKN